MSPNGDNTAAKYTLRYWRGLPGRGEYVRLAFEATATPFEDLAYKPGLFADRRPAPLAPPVLVHGEVVLSQLAVILDYLAPRLAVPGDSRAAVSFRSKTPAASRCRAPAPCRSSP